MFSTSNSTHRRLSRSVLPFLLLSIAWFSTYPCPARAQPQPSTIVVLTLQPEFGVDAAVARLLSEHIVGLVRDSRAFEKVLSLSDVQQLIGEEGSQQMSHCDSEGCLAELAGSFAAGFVLRGSIGKLGTSHLVALKLLDVRRAAVVASVSERIKGEDGDTLLDGVPYAVSKLLDNANIRHQLKAAAPPPAVAAAPASPPATAMAPVQKAPAPVAPPEESKSSGIGWKVLGGSALACMGVSCCLVAPLGAVGAYWGVGAATLMLLRWPPASDIAGGVAAVVAAVIPLAIGALAAAVGTFAFTRGPASAEAEET